MAHKGLQGIHFFFTMYPPSQTSGLGGVIVVLGFGGGSTVLLGVELTVIFGSIVLLMVIFGSIGDGDGEGSVILVTLTEGMTTTGRH